MMIVEMPYGLVEIKTQEQAMKFIRNHCLDCPFNSMLARCNHPHPEICERAVKSALLACKPRQVSYIPDSMEML